MRGDVTGVGTEPAGEGVGPPVGLDRGRGDQPGAGGLGRPGVVLGQAFEAARCEQIHSAVADPTDGHTSGAVPLTRDDRRGQRAGRRAASDGRHPGHRVLCGGDGGVYRPFGLAWGQLLAEHAGWPGRDVRVGPADVVGVIVAVIVAVVTVTITVVGRVTVLAEVRTEAGVAEPVGSGRTAPTPTISAVGVPPGASAGGGLGKYRRRGRRRRAGRRPGPGRARHAVTDHRDQSGADHGDAHRVLVGGVTHPSVTDAGNRAEVDLAMVGVVGLRRRCGPQRRSTRFTEAVVRVCRTRAHRAASPFLVDSVPSLLRGGVVDDPPGPRDFCRGSPTVDHVRIT